MPKLLAIITTLTLTLLAIACAGTSPQSRQGDAIPPFAREAASLLRHLRDSHQVLSDPEVGDLPASQQEERYNAQEEAARQAIERFADMDVPPNMAETSEIIAAMLANERNIWVHMVLYARTGDELHRILANELAVTSEEDAQAAARSLQDALDMAGIDSTELGLGDFSKSWRGEAATDSEGTYRMYFDNTDSDEHKVMHVLITYHRSAPGAVVPRRR